MGFDFTHFAQSLANQAAGRLRQARSPGDVAAALRTVTARVEADLNRHLGEESRHIACRAGCGTCCVVNVGVLFPEAMAICHYLEEQRSEAELADLTRRLDELFLETRWLDDEERIILRRPCVFLDDAGACTIYPVRPLLCRAVTSTDPHQCREALCAVVFGSEAPVLMNLFQKTLMETAFAGLAGGVEQAGLDARGLRLTAATRHLLADPGLGSAFLAGEKIAIN